ncbi:MAG TPA: beta-propeller fold lactonase family protein [Acidimicrobiales bacterium]|nr:beta-propeller fold lactonase family protein [Acidimicrobiales bacterium]
MRALTLVTGFLTTSSFAGATSAHDQAPSRQALFVETDQGPNNTVISYTRGTDGTISYVATYPTGGAGAAAAGSAADPLASQGGLALVDNGNELIATNPGSNSVSVFAVSGPYLHLVQQVPSGGSFPVSITAHDDLVAVLNSGGTGSLSEYRLRGARLAALSNETRSLSLANTTPPFFLAGAGQVGYSPNGQFLIATTKASTSSYEVFSVGGGGALSTSATVTGAANAVPFAFTFDVQGRVVAAEASNSSVSTYSIGADGALTLVGTVSDAQAALCWISTAQGYFFGSNAGSGDVSSFGETTGGAPTLLNAQAAITHPGSTDSAVSPDGAFLYVESGGSGALDAFAINANGTLTPIETLRNLPTPYEGIAVS